MKFADYESIIAKIAVAKAERPRAKTLRVFVSPEVCRYAVRDEIARGMEAAGWSPEPYKPSDCIVRFAKAGRNIQLRLLLQLKYAI